MNLIKLIKYGKYRNNDYWSIISTEDNYLEAATGGVL